MTVPVFAIFTVKSGKESQVESLFRSVIETTLKEDGCNSTAAQKKNTSFCLDRRVAVKSAT